MFFKQSWIIVYRIVILILEKCQFELLSNNETGDILDKLRNKAEFKKNVSIFSLEKSEEFWDTIFSKINSISNDVDDALIESLCKKYKVK